jgi:hypothetical protein
MIKVGDIVLHTISGLYYKCENNKQQRWMNMSTFYKVANDIILPPNYFIKYIG